MHNGDEAYPAMLSAIRAASRQVYLSSYIFDSSEVGRKFVTALADASNRGVEVRVLLDGIGNHRKILVVDGGVAFTGGMNIVWEIGRAGDRSPRHEWRR